MAVAAGDTLEVPEVASGPDHAPDAVHEVALVEDQVSVLLAPAVIELELAVNETVGGTAAGGTADTLTVTDWEAVPPVPLHESE